jgi:hypothetical protein
VGFCEVGCFDEGEGEGITYMKDVRSHCAQCITTHEKELSTHCSLLQQTVLAVHTVLQCALLLQVCNKYC